MELHHKLRRDPSWHPSGCNICGQLGHQAINCTNGTINWKQIYGEESFKLKAPVYPSEYDAIRKAKEVNVEKLKKLAEDWKQAHANVPMPDLTAGFVKRGPYENGPSMTGPSGRAAGAPPAAGSAPEPAALPEGWASTKDAQGRTYFWHKTTKKVQWDRPTADTPIS